MPTPDRPVEQPLELEPPHPDELIVGEDSVAEDIALRTGRDLKSAKTDRQLKKLLREEGVQSHLHRVIVIGIYIVAITAGAMFLAFVWHMVTPVSWAFLDADQLTSIKQVLFSGSIGAGISGLAKKHLGIGGEKE